LAKSLQTPISKSNFLSLRDIPDHDAKGKTTIPPPANTELNMKLRRAVFTYNQRLKK
jgi:hypothetical protein